MPGFPPERTIHTYFDKHDKRHTITVQNQSKSLAGFFKVNNLKHYGSDDTVKNLYMAYTAGVFQHALECQPLLKKEQYAALQKLICNELKKIYRLEYYRTGKHLSYSELLKRANTRTLFNTHRYLGLNKLNTIFCTGKPETLYNELVKTLIPDKCDYVMNPFNDDETPDGLNKFDKCKKYFYDVQRDEYSVKMCVDYNELKIKGITKKQALTAWPYCFIDEFNKIPREIRALFGTFNFKKEIKLLTVVSLGNLKFNKSLKIFPFVVSKLIK